MQLGSLVFAGMCGIVGVFAGRITRPASAVVIAAAPVHDTKIITVAAPPVETRADEDEDGDGIDIGDALAQVKAEAAIQDQAAHNVVRGTLTDQETREPAVGATVVIAGPAMEGEQVVITDETGGYVIAKLPSGYYTMTIYYNDTTTTRESVFVSEMVPTTQDMTLETHPRVQPQVIEFDGEPPPDGIDLELHGEDYIRNIPIGRTFSAVLGAAAGEQDDAIGTTISSGGLVENIYIVDDNNSR